MLIEMALQLRDSRVKISKLTGAFVAVFALLIQPLVTLDIPSAFAASSEDQYAKISAATSCVAGNAVITITGKNKTNQTASGTYSTAYGNGTISAGPNATVTEVVTTSQSSISADQVQVEVTSPTPLSYVAGYSAINCASVTVGTAGDFTTLQEGIDNVATGGTITFVSNVSTSAKVSITKPVTINGGGYTITATSGMTGAVIEEQNISGVTVSNLVIDGGGNYLHPFKTFKGTVNLNDVTLRNSGKQGLLVNSATVTVNNLTTSGNAWGGVNVDQSSSSSNPAVLTVNGTSHHTETLADIYIDDTTEAATVNDTSSQYDISNPGVKPNDQAYKLKTSSPVRNITTDKGFATIQAAIDDSATTNGDIIEVSDGTFDEFTVVAGADSNLTIRAATGANPVIEATTPSSNRVVDLRGVGTIVEGFTIRSFQAGNGNVVYLDGDENVIRNNTIEGSTSDGSNGIFTASTASNPTGNNTITGNTIVSPRGINLRNTGNIVTNNKVTSTVKSLSVEREGNTIEFNNFYSGAVRAVQSYNAIDLNVEKNWWGQDTGVDPAAVVVDSAGGSIDSDPWLCGPFETSPAISSASGSCAPADTTAPTVSNITALPMENGNIGKTTTVTFDLNDATGIDPSKTKVLFSDGPNDLNRAKESSKFTPVLVSGNTYKVTINTQDFVKKNYSGNYNLKFELWDTLGNHKSAKPSTFRGILIDNAGPSISDVRVNNPVNGEAEIRVKMSDPSDVNLTSGTYVRFTHGVSANGAASSSANAKFVYETSTDDYVATIDTTDFADNASGTYWVYVRAQDKLGNASANDDTRGIVIDNAGPEVSFTQPTANKVVRGNMDVKVTATDESDLGAYCLKVDGGSCVAGGYAYHPANGAMPTVTIDTSALTEGEHTLIARVTDRLNNATEVERTFIVDRTNPVVAITAPADSSTVSGTVTITGTVTDANPDHYYLVVKDNTGSIVAGPRTVNENNVQDYAWNTRNVSDGTYTILLSAKDAAGNKDGSATTPGSSVDTVTVTVDNTAPSLSLNTPTRNSDGTYTLTGTTDDSDSPVVVSLDGVEVDTIAPSNGTFSFTTTTPLADGPHTFSATSTDDQGNSASAPSTVSFVAVTPTQSGSGTGNGGTNSGISNNGDGTQTLSTPGSISSLSSDSTSSLLLANTGSTGSVLGASINNDKESGDNGQVLGTKSDSSSPAETAAVAPSPEGWKLWGIAWYWFLLALALLAAFWWMLAGWRRRRAEDAADL